MDVSVIWAIAIEFGHLVLAWWWEAETKFEERQFMIASDDGMPCP
jgi:hypothetical protein